MIAQESDLSTGKTLDTNYGLMNNSSDDLSTLDSCKLLFDPIF